MPPCPLGYVLLWSVGVVGVHGGDITTLTHCTNHVLQAQYTPLKVLDVWVLLLAHEVPHMKHQVLLNASILAIIHARPLTHTHTHTWWYCVALFRSPLYFDAWCSPA